MVGYYLFVDSVARDVVYLAVRGDDECLHELTISRKYLKTYDGGCVVFVGVLEEYLYVSGR